MNASGSEDVATSEAGEVSWHLVQVKPNSAHIAERNLVRQGFGVFAPRVARTVRRAGKFHEQRELLFPGYLFVAVDLRSRRWRSIGSTTGVQRLVCFGEGPAEVPPLLIEMLQHRYAAPAPETLRKGAKVRVVKGPLADLVATIESVAADQRIWIILDLLGQSTRISLSRAHLEPA